MKHEDFKIIVDGKELSYPALRMLAFFCCGIVIGILMVL